MAVDDEEEKRIVFSCPRCKMVKDVDGVKFGEYFKEGNSHTKEGHPNLTVADLGHRARLEVRRTSAWKQMRSHVKADHEMNDGGDGFPPFYLTGLW